MLPFASLVEVLLYLGSLYLFQRVKRNRERLRKTQVEE
jgi:hypothetical protein